jgi:hypothetical protein
MKYNKGGEFKQSRHRNELFSPSFESFEEPSRGMTPLCVFVWMGLKPRRSIFQSIRRDLDSSTEHLAVYPTTAQNNDSEFHHSFARLL